MYAETDQYHIIKTQQLTLHQTLRRYVSQSVSQSVSPIS